MNVVPSRREFLAGTPLLAAATARPRPNIVFIVSDDHHWQCLGAAGNPNIHTPALDRLAARGVNFSNATISCAQCCPSRGVLLSGLESYQSGLDSNGHTAFRTFHGQTIVEQLRRSGYQTSLVGKWHVDPMPRECGFTEAPLWLRGGASVYRDPKLRSGLDARDATVPGHITDLLTDAAVHVIESARQPYLLWLTYNAPHTPWYAGEKYLAPYRGRNRELAPPAHPKPPASGDRGFDWETYYAVISHLDEGVGRVVNAVEKTGQWANTLVVFLGDNGYLCGAKGLQGKVHPWEPSVRVPLILSGGLVHKAARSDAMAASVDLPATFLDYAGVKPSHALAGTSLRSVLAGHRFSRDAAFASWNDGRPEGLAIMQAVEPYRAVRTRSLKYVLWESRKQALFDLAADPHEDRDLSADSAHATDLRKMRSRLEARMKATADSAIAWLRS
ncbi:MAG: sulfatase-like hydrolase/transferase [Bryobacteraceae bacterium]